jgi:enoyl-CoA hydratase/carnithine racemase
MSNAINVETRDDACIIRFTRPEARNPLSIDVLDQLHRIVDESFSSKLIFTGSGDVFASGADLREIANVNGENAEEFGFRGQRLMSKIAAHPQKTIAAVNGLCFGGALDLALACNIRIASPSAEFCHPGANLGIMTGWGGTQRLPRLIGEARALEMFLAAKRMLADEALSVGLIDQISKDPLSAALNH